MRFDVMPVATEKQILEVEEAANHVWHNYYKDIFSEEQIDYMLEKFQSREALKAQISSGYVYYMILADGELAGYMCYIIKDDHVFLSRLYIKAEYRRQGLARKTIAHLENIFLSPENDFQNIRKIRLNVERKNSFAINVYEHLGFKRVKPVNVNIGRGFFCEDYVMERAIKE